MTDIVPVPDIRLSTEFPTNADRTAGVFNKKAVDWANSSRVMASDMDDSAEATHQNSIAAKEAADIAVPASAQAVTAKNEAVLAKNESIAAKDDSIIAKDQSVSAKNASVSAKDQSASSASASLESAIRAEAAAASIEDGPVTSVNGKTGVVSLAAEDIAPLATKEEMQAGVEGSPKSISPYLVGEAIKALGVSQVGYSARSSNTQLVSADTGKLIDITNGTFTQTFLEPSALGAGWWCYIRNNGVGDITIPSSDGVANWIMYPGEIRFFQSDGLMLRTFVVSSFYKTFISSGDFRKPPGYTSFDVDSIGASGGAASGSTVPSGGATSINRGGGAGGRSKVRVLSDSCPDTVLVGIGAGGVGGASPASNSEVNPGTAGGDTNFGNLVTGFGGGRGYGSTTAAGVGGRAGAAAPGAAATISASGAAGAGQPSASELLSWPANAGASGSNNNSATPNPGSKGADSGIAGGYRATGGAGGSISGQAGDKGEDAPLGTDFCGAGGGGGYGGVGVGGAGGDGGAPGGAPGSGGIGSGGTAGKGGNGARGECRVKGVI